MPRYFFDVDDGDGDPIRDDTGFHLFSDEAARREGYSIIAKYASNPINLLVDGMMVVTVREASSRVVTTLRMVFQETRGN